MPFQCVWLWGERDEKAKRGLGIDKSSPAGTPRSWKLSQSCPDSSFYRWGNSKSRGCLGQNHGAEWWWSSRPAGLANKAVNEMMCENLSEENLGWNPSSQTTGESVSPGGDKWRLLNASTTKSAPKQNKLRPLGCVFYSLKSSANYYMCLCLKDKETYLQRN